MNTYLQRWIGLVVMLFLSAGLMTPLAVQGQQISQQSHAATPVSWISLADAQDLFYRADLLREISLDIREATLEEGLRQLAEETGLRLTYRGDIMVDKTVTLQSEAISVSAALAELLEETGLEYQVSRHGYLLISRAEQVDQEVLVQQTVGGSVTDATTGEALPGVNVVIQGTSTGTVTDAGGRFSLNVPDLNRILIVSYIGYERQEVAISGRSELDIRLQPLVLMGEEMVVTAFGFTRERASVSYSTAEVSGESLVQAREVNVANSLAGRMAGVDVQGNNMGPGSSSRVVIRGNTSLAGDNQPLYVVNGIPINNDTRGGQGSTGRTVYGDRGDGISHINPDDIESITVLKGGQATALYGSRAANGVILITTKQGTARQGLGVEFNSNSTFETISRFPDWQYEYGHGTGGQRPQTQQQATSQGRLSFGERFDGQPYMQIDGEMRPYEPVSVKRNMREFYDVGRTYTNSLAFTGGGESIRYRLSLSNLDNKPIQPNSSYTRRSVNLSTNADVTERLKVGAVVQYNVVEGFNRPKGGYATHNASWGVLLLNNSTRIETLAPGYHPDGSEILWNASAAAPNPYLVINRYENTDDEVRILGNVDVSYSLMDNLIVNGRFGRDYSDLNTGHLIPYGTAAHARGEFASSQRTLAETTGLMTLNYMDTFFEDYNVQAMVGGNIEHREVRSNSLNGQDFIVPFFYSYTNLAATSPGRGYSEMQTNSLFGSLEMDYRRIFYLTLTGRQDWFSTLHPDNNSVFYPSVGASMVLSEAIQLPSAIDFLKIRGSWAEIGSAIVSPYQINPSYTFATGGFFGRPIQNPGGIPNPDLQPLSNETFEVGIDLQLLENRLGFDLSLYQSTTRDDIVQTDIPSSSGYSSTLLNVGELRNRGIEFQVRGNPVRGSDFNWNVTYNVAYNESEILSLAEGLDVIRIGGDAVNGADVRHMVGRPYGTVWGRLYSQNSAGQLILNPANGFPIPTEFQEIGLGVAPLTMGLANDFNYRNFSLSILLDAKFGHVISSNTEWYGYRFGLPKETLAGRENGLNMVGVDQNGNPVDVTIAPNAVATFYNAGGNYEGRFIHPADFLKLREVVFGYNLPQSFLSYAGIQSARVSVVGRNLLSFDKVPHIDPESGNTSDNVQGLEGFGLPPTRSIGFNVSLNF